MQRHASSLLLLLLLVAASSSTASDEPDRKPQEQKQQQQQHSDVLGLTTDTFADVIERQPGPALVSFSNPHPTPPTSAQTPPVCRLLLCTVERSTMKLDARCCMCLSAGHVHDPRLSGVSRTDARPTKGGSKPQGTAAAVLPCSSCCTIFVSMRKCAPC